LPSLVGRTFLILGGGYLLRALAETGVVAPIVGVTAGLAYAAFWLWRSDRAAARGDPHGGAFHGLAAASLAFPLVFEAGTTFSVLTAPSSMAALVLAVTGGGLMIAWRRWLRSLAWTFSIGAVAVMLPLMALTGAIAPFGLVLVIVSVAALWLGYTREWLVLRWPLTGLTNLILLIMAWQVLAPRHTDTLPAVLIVQFALLAGFLASFAARTLGLGRDVIPFEVVQSAAALVVGFGGAVSITWATHPDLIPALGVAALAIGLGLYGVAFAFVARRGSRRNLFFYATLALVLAIPGVLLAFPAWAAALASVVLALLVGLLPARDPLERLVLTGQSALYLVAAAVSSGLLQQTVLALVVPAAVPGGLPSWASIVVVAAALWQGSTLSSRRRFALSGRNEDEILITAAGAVRSVVLACALVGLAGVMVRVALAIAPADWAASTGRLAMVRTCALAAVVVLAGLVGRIGLSFDPMWIVYGLLAGAGLKLVLEDFVQSRAGLFAVDLIVYGLALIVGPRLARGSRDERA
jgi:hypothetical protein